MLFQENAKKFWNFLKQDTWQSLVVSLILLVILIKFIIFPGLSLVTATELPIVVVESCSMYHSEPLEDWYDTNKIWYKKSDIFFKDFKTFSLKNGLNKGDIVFLHNRGEYKLGDIIVFHAGTQNPIIHRIVDTDPIGTKGDNGKTNPSQLEVEKEIPEERVIGKAVGKIPALGWIKLIFFEPLRSQEKRGFCE